MKINWCRCIYEPRGENGLEGYLCGEKYRYEYRERDRDGKPYYRVYPVFLNNYYETCGTKVFSRYFKKIFKE